MGSELGAGGAGEEGREFLSWAESAVGWQKPPIDLQTLQICCGRH